MRSSQLLCVLALAGACSGGGGTTHDAGADAFLFPDAPDTAPTLTSFMPTPASVQAGVPTPIMWSWTYLVDPVSPAPTCTIDQGVGEVTNGQTTMVTLTQTTTYRLTCSNRVGMTARDTVIQIPPAAPNLATFTATPSPLMPNAATTVTFTWTYATPPSPPPTCTIDAGIGAATSGMTASVTLTQARTFRLRCTNTQGTSFRDATVGVNECAGGTHDCNVNATCTDTAEGFACTCNAGYTGNGDTCSANAQCGVTPSLCDPNAICVGGSQCVCNTGFIGSGTACTRARLTFVTTGTGNGNLSTAGGWTGAGALTGLAAADTICQAEAMAASLPGTYVAWMSDSNNDAYCRAHGLTGKKSAMCGLGALPVAAGPWVRTDAARTPAAPTIDKLLAPTRQTFYPVTYRAGGIDTVGTTPQLVYTGTDDTGVYAGTTCTDWTTSAGTGAMGDMMGGGTAWTDQGADPSCSATGRLRCVETGAGPALPSRHPTLNKRAFVTSVNGGAVLSTWADAQGLSGISAADAICQARARYAGYTNAANFKAWMSTSTSASSRVFYSNQYYRPDGIPFATRTIITGTSTSGRVTSPLYQTETGAYLPGNADLGSVWTGTYYYGLAYSSTSGACSSWLSASTSYTALIGRTDLADFRWQTIGTGYGSPSFNQCTATDYRLYCLDDTP